MVARAGNSVEAGALARSSRPCNAVTDRLKAMSAGRGGRSSSGSVLLARRPAPVVAKGTGEVHFTVTLSVEARGPRCPKCRGRRVSSGRVRGCGRCLIQSPGSISSSGSSGRTRHPGRAWARWSARQADRDLRARRERGARARRRAHKDQPPGDGDAWSSRSIRRPGGIRRHARLCEPRVARWLPPPREGATGDDIAGLILADKTALQGAAPARLAVDVPRPGRTVRIFGYPAGRPEGGWVEAAVRGPVGGGRLQLDSAPESALRVQPGFSGSPVFDDATGRIVGLLAGHWRPSPGDATATRSAWTGCGWRGRRCWPAGGSPGGTGGARAAGRGELTILHVSDLRFERDRLPGTSAAERAEHPMFGQLHTDLAGLAGTACGRTCSWSPGTSPSRGARRVPGRCRVRRRAR